MRKKEPVKHPCGKATLAFLPAACCLAFLGIAFAQAPTSPVRAPAEFEPVEGVLIQWDYDECNDLHRFLVETIEAAGATAFVLVDDAANQDKIVRYLQSKKVPLERVRFIVAPTDSLWVRDYAPTSIYYGPDKTRGFVDWKYSYPDQVRDDAAPAAVAQALGATLFLADRGPRGLILDGGDLMTDGFGTIFVSQGVARENGNDPAKLETIRHFLGAERCILLEELGSSNDKHLDMYMKMLDEETILVGEYAAGVPNREIVERNVQVLQGLVSCYGTPYRIVRVPMPGDTAAGDLRTYTNSLIVNNYVLVPVYGIPMDEKALQVYRDALPGYHVASYDCSNVIKQRGALHCITHEVAAAQVIRIAHARLTQPVLSNVSVTIEAKVWSPVPVETVFVHLKMNGQAEFARYPMQEAAGTYTAFIQTTAAGEAQYYLSAHAKDLTGYEPQNGPDGGYLTVQIAEPPHAAASEKPPGGFWGRWAARVRRWLRR